MTSGTSRLLLGVLALSLTCPSYAQPAEQGTPTKVEHEMGSDQDNSSYDTAAHTHAPTVPESSATESDSAHATHMHGEHGATEGAPMQHMQHMMKEEEPDASLSEREHIPPDPPQHEPADMSTEEMSELMRMDDNGARMMVLANRLEYRDVDSHDALNWDVTGWYGTDYTKLFAKSEGTRVQNDSESRNELLVDRIFARYWSVQGGVRQDLREGSNRTWFAVGVEGLAPYWFDVEATFYVGEGGRLAFRGAVDYDLLLTQRLILQPELEIEAYSKNDASNSIGSGVSESELGLRLRYEFRREFAPYIGVLWTRAYADTADVRRVAGEDTSDVQIVAGIRVWY